MDIKTKYEIGQRIWFVYEKNKEVHVYDDIINEIVVNKNRNSLRNILRVRI